LAAVKRSIQTTKLIKAKELFEMIAEALTTEEFHHIDKLFIVKISESQIEKL